MPRLKAMTWNMANQDKESTDPAAVINLKVNIASWTSVEEVLFIIMYICIVCKMIKYGFIRFYSFNCALFSFKMMLNFTQEGWMWSSS